MKAKKPLVLATASFAAVVAAIALWLLWYAPPLRLSSDYSVSYTVSGQAHSDAQLFRPVGISFALLHSRSFPIRSTVSLVRRGFFAQRRSHSTVWCQLPIWFALVFIATRRSGYYSPTQRQKSPLAGVRYTERCSVFQRRYVRPSYQEPMRPETPNKIE